MSTILTTLCTPVGLLLAMVVTLAGASASASASARPSSTNSPNSASALQLSEVIARAQFNHPAVVIARHAVSAARGGLRAANGAFDTQLRAGAGAEPIGPYDRLAATVGVIQPTRFWGATVVGGYRYGAGFPGYKGEYVSPVGGELHVGLQIPLLKGRAIDAARFGLQAARARITMAKTLAANTQRLIALYAGNTWVDWVAAQAKLRVAKTQLRLAQTRRAALRKRVQRGAIARMSLVDNQRSLTARQAKLISAKQKLAQSSIKLGLYLRDGKGRPAPPSVARTPVGGLQVGKSAGAATLLVALNQIESRRPDLKARTIGLKLRRAELRLLRQRLLPSLKLNVEATRGIGRGVEWLRGEVTPPRLALRAKLIFALPVQRRKAAGKWAMAEAKLRAAEVKFGLAADKVRAEVRYAHVAWQAAAQRHAQRVAASKAARTVAAGERQKWALGRSDLLRVQLREQVVAKAELHEIAVAAQWHRARLAFLAAAALPALR